MLKPFVILAALGLSSMVLIAAQASDAALHERAMRILKASPIIDGHNDYPWEVHEKGKGDVDALDMRKPQPTLMTDIPRLRAGGVGGQFWSVYVPVTLQGQAAVTETLGQIEIVHRMMA